jgi:hypothetical protein
MWAGLKFQICLKTFAVNLLSLLKSLGKVPKTSPFLSSVIIESRRISTTVKSCKAVPLSYVFNQVAPS